jgi:hypothetical protein
MFFGFISEIKFTNTGWGQTQPRRFSLMNFLNVLLIFFLLVFSSGCATVMHGSTQDIGITTDPPGADLLVDGQTHYQSPATLILSRKNAHLVEVSKEGYEEETVRIKQTMSPAVLGDFLLPGGYVVDAATGAQVQLVPDNVSVTLRPSNQTIIKLDGMTIIRSR